MISGILYGRADDVADLYADGAFLTTITNPFITSVVTLRDDTGLLAVCGENKIGHYGFIIKLSNGVVTDTHWRCNNTEHSDWYKLSYNDEDWQPAKIIPLPDGWSHDLDPAEFIWAKTYTPVVYCRGWLSKYYQTNT